MKSSCFARGAARVAVNQVNTLGALSVGMLSDEEYFLCI